MKGLKNPNILIFYTTAMSQISHLYLLHTTYSILHLKEGYHCSWVSHLRDLVLSRLLLQAAMPARSSIQWFFNHSWIKTMWRLGETLIFLFFISFWNLKTPLEIISCNPLAQSRVNLGMLYLHWALLWSLLHCFQVFICTEKMPWAFSSLWWTTSLSLFSETYFPNY